MCKSLSHFNNPIVTWLIAQRLKILNMNIFLQTKNVRTGDGHFNMPHKHDNLLKPDKTGITMIEE